LGRKLTNEVEDIEVSIETDKLLPSSDKVDDVTTQYSTLLTQVQTEAQSFLDRLNEGTIGSYSLSTLSYKLNKFAEELIPDSDSAAKTMDTDERLQLMKAQLEFQQAAKQMESFNLQYLDQIKQTRQAMIGQLGQLIEKIEKIKTGDKMALAENSDETYDLSSASVGDLVKEATDLLAFNAQKPFPMAPWDQATETYKARLTRYISGYGDYLFTEVLEKVGHCEPLHDIHSAIYDATCNQVLADYNQFWFFLLIGTLCLLPLMFLALKLSNHYRILEPQDPDSFDHRFQAEGVPLKTVEPLHIETNAENNGSSANSPARNSTNPRSVTKPSPNNNPNNSPPEQQEPKFELNLRTSQGYQPTPPKNPPTSRPGSQSPPSQATTPSVGGNYSPLGTESAYETMEYGKRPTFSTGQTNYGSSVGYQPVRMNPESPIKQTNIC